MLLPQKTIKQNSERVGNELEINQSKKSMVSQGLYPQKLSRRRKYEGKAREDPPILARDSWRSQVLLSPEPN